VPLAVVTGGYQDVCRQILARVGIADCFDTIVASEDTTRHKPDPEPFLEAARRLGARPERCVVWEDSGLGIEAARRAGMQWIDVRSFHTPARVRLP
jgi:HAD superfamily hydrolase (TIGR01509 family)